MDTNVPDLNNMLCMMRHLSHKAQNAENETQKSRTWRVLFMYQQLLMDMGNALNSGPIQDPKPKMKKARLLNSGLSH